MSLLELKSRPWTVFDPAHKEHRRWFHQFTQHGTWGRCPYRFIVPDDHGDLITMIQRSLVKYYVEHEFRIVVKKPQKTVRKK
jgi:hypothetical protein